MKNIKYLIVPDVHGRGFWRQPVEETLKDTDAVIIYLGDFLDPYKTEWAPGEDYQQISISTFQEILDLKKQYPDRIILLLGNHDCGYCISPDICSCRMDYLNAGNIRQIFRDNRELFKIAWECMVNGQHYVFTHAGILKGWVKQVWREAAEKINVVDALNNAWDTNDRRILDTLGSYDGYRGWGGDTYGSPVWSDIRSWTKVTQEETYGYNIVGHTMCKAPVVLDTIADLDCQQTFYIDEQGVLRSYDTDEILR